MVERRARRRYKDGDSTYRGTQLGEALSTSQAAYRFMGTGLGAGPEARTRSAMARGERDGGMRGSLPR